MKKTGILPFLLSWANMDRWPDLCPPQASHNPGDIFTGRSKTFKRNLRIVQKAQRHRAFCRSLRRKK